MGLEKRPSKIEDKQKVKVQYAPWVVIPTWIVIREEIVEARAEVTRTSQFITDPVAPGTSFTRAKNKGVYIRTLPNNNSSTPTDPEILELLRDLEDIANNFAGKKSPRKRNMEASLQTATIGVGQSSATNKFHAIGKQKSPWWDTTRYWFRKELSKSLSSLHVDKAADKKVQPKEVIADLIIKQA